MTELNISSLYKSYGSVEVLEGLNLDIKSGEFLVLLGPSGCGKSTLLRIIAGLEDETAGDIKLDGKSVTHLPPAKRGIAMVFQSYALYPHLSVRGNMALVLKQARLGKQEIEKRVAESSRALELDPLLDRKPAELSGGQRQRVAIGRAIVRDPKVFLFDEPLSNLDAALRGQVRMEIARLHMRLKDATMVYVTHDQIEAMTLADRIVVMHDGKIQQVGAPRDLYERPENLFVAGFIGSPKMNLLPLDQIKGGRAYVDADTSFELPEGALHDHANAVMGIRPSGCKLLDVDSKGDGLIGEVMISEYLGEVSYVHVTLENGTDMVVQEDPSRDYESGSKVKVTVDRDSIHLFDGDTTSRI